MHKPRRLCHTSVASKAGSMCMYRGTTVLRSRRRMSSESTCTIHVACANDESPVCSPQKIANAQSTHQLQSINVWIVHKDHIRHVERQNESEHRTMVWQTDSCVVYRLSSRTIVVRVPLPRRWQPLLHHTFTRMCFTAQALRGHWRNECCHAPKYASHGSDCSCCRSVAAAPSPLE